MSFIGLIIRPLRSRRIRRQNRGWGYPDRVASRRVRDGRFTIKGGDEAGGVVTRDHAEPLAGFIQMSVDRVLGDAQAAGDLFRA
jgi:hypothetical protein